MAMVAVMMVTIADKNIIIIIVIIIIMTMMIVNDDRDGASKHVVVKCSKGVFAIISKHVYTW